MQDKHYFLFHIGFLQIQKYILKAQATPLLPSITHPTPFLFQLQESVYYSLKDGEKGAQLLFLLLGYYGTKEICQVSTLDF